MPDFGDVDPDTGRTSARTQFEGTLDPLAPSVANGQISPAQWAEYQAKRRRDAILGVLGVLGGSAALGFAGNALSGAGGAVSSAVPGVVSGAPLGTGTVSATLPSATFGAMAPYAGTVAMNAPGLTGAGMAGMGGAAGAGGGSLLGMNPRDLLSLGTGLAGMVGGAISGRNNRNAMTPNTTTTDPQLAKLLATMQGRLDKSEPLIDSIMSMANGLLPTQYQKGGGGMP